MIPEGFIGRQDHPKTRSSHFVKSVAIQTPSVMEQWSALLPAPMIFATKTVSLGDGIAMEVSLHANPTPKTRACIRDSLTSAAE